MSKQISFLIFATIILLTFHTLVVSAFSVQIDWPAKVSFIEKTVYLNRFYSDFFIALGLASLFFSKNNFLKFISGLILFLFLAAYFIQFQSYTTAGRFLPLIALENLAHADFLDSDNIIFSGIIWAILFIVACRLIHTLNHQHINLATRIGFAIFVFVVSTIIKNDKYYINDSIAAKRFDFYNSGRPGIAHVSPLSELKDTLEDYQKYLYMQRSISSEGRPLSAAAAEFTFKYYNHLTNSDSDFPLIHKSDFENPLPFESLLNHQKPTNDEALENSKKNIIVFFAEGISSRIIQPYSQHLPGISPNIESFSRNNNIQINNYYNHTFATSRGLGGQLCSIFPIGRLYEKVNYHCLPHILNEQGYSSHFLFSQDPKYTALDEVLSRAGFQEIESAPTVIEKLRKSSPLANNLNERDQGLIITDKELFLGLVEKLKDHERSETPFFMGIYNFETHTGVNLISDNTVYQRANAESSKLLNTFHNFDQAFGLFWNYFKESPHAKDTIVVLTSDHATFPSRDYLELDIGAPKIFVDEIPLLIYHPDLVANFQLDAVSRTSVDFAPTILDILDIKSQTTAFIGESLFKQKTLIPRPITGGYQAIWRSLEGRSGLWEKIDIDTKRSSPSITKGVDHFEFIQYSADLERQNKLCPTPTQK